MDGFPIELLMDSPHIFYRGRTMDNNYPHPPIRVVQWTDEQGGERTPTERKRAAHLLAPPLSSEPSFSGKATAIYFTRIIGGSG